MLTSTRTSGSPDRAARGRRRAPAIAFAIAAFLPLTGCGSTRATQDGAALPAALLAGMRPIGTGPRFQAAATGPVLGQCEPWLGTRVGVHVEVFAANRVVLLPAGIGTRPPRTFSGGRISGARCFGELVTLEPTGVVQVRAGTDLRLSDLFHSWGQPLSTQRVGPFSPSPGESVAVFVNGRRWAGLPGAVPLSPHAEVVLEVGPFVPPHRSYTFPPGT